MKTDRDVEGWMKSAHFIPGVYNMEDIIHIPETRWIVGSGLTTMGPGMDDPVIVKNYLHVFDAQTESVRRVASKDIIIGLPTPKPIQTRQLRPTGRPSGPTGSASVRGPATSSPCSR
ncbi:MAG: hypothetical protein PVH21_04515 [Myxococcales bacterium]|jgi:hypothetical protein